MNNALKVSVVVPVYNPGTHIDGLIESLRQQTMPAGEFEAIFVDDGSTDGTGERLDRVAAEASNFRVIHIPNSGWPGMPRNVGMDAAQGEYLQFVDNDDELGVEALQRLYDYAVENDSDVVIGKEVRRNVRRAVVPLFTKNRPNATLEHDPLLNLLTPHKMFRRAFLDEHGLRFPEGPRRLEDHPFVVKAYFRAKVISVLGDYPCYYWIQRLDKSNAGLRPREWDEWYGHMRDVLDVVEEHTDPGEFRDRLLSHWYRTKGLRLLGASLAGRPPEDARRLYNALRELTLERFPPSVDAHVPGIMRVRAALLRAGDYDRILELADAERGMTLGQDLDVVRQVDGGLEVKAAAWLAYADGSPLVAELEGDRVYWRPPVDLGPAVSRDLLDITAGLEGTNLDIVLRDRETHEMYPQPGETGKLPPAPDGLLRLGAVRTVRVDPATAVDDDRLRPGVWDVDLQLGSTGWHVRTELRSTSGAARNQPLLPPILADAPVLAYTTGRGTVAVDVDQRAISLIKAARPRPRAASLDPVPGGVALTLPLRGLAVPAGGVLAAQVQLTPVGGGTTVSRPAKLTGGAPGEDGRLRTELEIRSGGQDDGLPAGRWTVVLASAGHSRPLGLLVKVDPSGGVSLERSAQRPSRPADEPQRFLARVPGVRWTARRLRRAAGRIRGR